MEEGLVTLVCIILLIIGILGTFLPVLPGLIVSYAGLLIYKFGTNSDMSMGYIWIFGILTLLSAILNYVIPAKTNKNMAVPVGEVLVHLLALYWVCFYPGNIRIFNRNVNRCFVGELLHDRKDHKKHGTLLKVL